MEHSSVSCDEARKGPIVYEGEVICTESALIASGVDKSTAFLTELLRTADVRQITAVPSAGEAQRLLLERDYELVVVNAPLTDESGEALSRHIASNGLSQVILIVKHEYFDAVSAACEGDGVLTVAKPIDRAVLWAALRLAGAASTRLKHMNDENLMLRQKIEDMRIVGRAKCLLASRHGMSEQDAHRYIEKHAMDRRTTRRAIAEAILKTYES